MRCIAIAAFAGLAVGCAGGTRPNFQAEWQRTIPTCTEPRECEIKWAAARRWLLNNAGFKLQHVTDDFLETYNPPQHSADIAVRVVKEPLQPEGYRFVVSVWCNNMFGCQPNQWEAAVSFNEYVNSSYP